ncbi:bifunctional hydroxymethylpyrimidine kinase/phosphomethylpyrimidine kinase [Rhodocyclus tenuis]|uniref:hydroxymethylpyrimidine kinase n=1 Tax=Rhodocyclus tenuis TaxID=1066 RepID=A0A840G357_RHOTE|nr:hydroxymethylpyrimidine/phosphomethylpyrimidine kinase [Rhodocyclus tenuis]MBB4246355.1 hydroxymethylpyrimidine/phosphomethylpyrimidine kinase [Rhodocyclus tenuis]
MEQTARPLPASSPPIVLSFAASDPSGGAGVQADLLTLAANGCHPLSVLTAITVQDTAGVEAVLPIDANWVGRQARTLLADMPVAAFKIGLIGSADNIAVIAAILAEHPDIPVVLDPVLASGRGDELANAAAIGALRELLLPRVSVLTPNSLEARRLLADDQEFQRRHGDSGDAGEPSLADCAARLITHGCRTVLVTGTHENTAQVVNTLYDASGCLRRDVWDRLPGEYHGSGCTLASAIAAGLAHGLPLAEAVRAGQDYTWRTLAAGFRAGRGQFIPDRFFDRFCDHAAQQRSSNA